VWNVNHKILAVLGGLGPLVHVEQTAELACHLSEERGAGVIFVYPIIVPLALPLDAPLPDQERDARDAIERAMWVASQRGCNARARVVRHRRAADAVLELERAEHVEKIVLGVRLNLNVPHEYDQAEAMEEEILRRAECEVIVDRESMAM
jgi:hypothetical protein